MIFIPIYASSDAHRVGGSSCWLRASIRDDRLVVWLQQEGGDDGSQCQRHGVWLPGASQPQGLRMGLDQFKGGGKIDLIRRAVHVLMAAWHWSDMPMLSAQAVNMQPFYCQQCLDQCGTTVA